MEGTQTVEYDAQGKPLAPAQEYDASGNPIAAAPTRPTPTQAPANMTPDVAADVLKAGVHSKMLGISASAAYESRDLIDKQFREKAGDYDGELDPTIMNDIKVGWQSSVLGLYKRDKLPDQIKNQGIVDKFAQSVSEMISDLPTYIAGGLAGGGAGAAAGSEAPVIGNVTLGAIGAGAGAFALPAALREALTQNIKNGKVQGFGDLMHRAAATVWAGTKGALTGTASALTGGVPVPEAAGMVGGLAIKGLYQTTALTTAGDILDGHVPNAKDFAGNAALIVPLEIVTGGHFLGGKDIKNAQLDLYAENGTTPQESTQKQLAQPVVLKDRPTGLVAAIKVGDEIYSANDGEHHAEFSQRALGQKPVEMDQLEADPTLADSVLRKPEIQDQPVIDRARQIKQEAIERGEGADQSPEGKKEQEGGKEGQDEPPKSVEEMYPEASTKSGRGFQSPDGKFLSREEAAAWVKENESDVHEQWAKDSETDQLDSHEYFDSKKAADAKNVMKGEPDFQFLGPRLAKFMAGSREYLNKVLAGEKSSSFGNQLLRTLWTGPRNMLRAEGAELVGRLRKAVPDELDQRAISFMRDYSGQEDDLRQEIENVRNGDNEKLKAQIPAMERALNPSSEMQDASKQLTDYFTKALDRSRQLGIFQSSIDPSRYSPRMFQEALDEEEAGGGARSAKFTTRTPNSIERRYKNVLDPLKSGDYEAQTFNAFDETSIYADRHAVSVATKMLLTQLSNSEVGKFGTRDEHPKGWQQLAPGKRAMEQTHAYLDEEGKPQIASKSYFVPKLIADAMKPVLEDTGYSQLGKGLHLQSITKGLELGLSVFHMKAMTVTAMNNMSLKGYLTALHSDNNSPAFDEMEQIGALHGLTTTKTGPEYEAYKGLKGVSEKGGFNLASVPVIKQVDAIAKKITDETFNVIQRKFKVTDFTAKRVAWEARNPDATPAEHGAAMRGYAKEVNAAYGGLNWEVMGISKGTQDVMRMFFLAPDWTFSNVANLKYAGEGGTAGNAARMFWAKSFVTGFGMSAAASISAAAINGGNTQDAFKKWSEQPENVYLGKDEKGKDMYSSMFFAGAPKDAIHLVTRIMKEKSAIMGTAEIIAGKSGPGLGALFGLAGNKDYAGKPIADKKEGWERDVDAAKFLGEKALPISGVSTAQTIAKALMDPNHNYSYKDILELAADAAGSPVYHEGGAEGKTASRASEGTRSEPRTKSRYSALKR